MTRFLISLLLLPVFLALQAVWLAPVIIMLFAYNISLLARVIKDTKQESTNPSIHLFFQRWWMVVVYDEDWVVQLFMMFFPMLFWTAFAFPKLEIFE